MMPYSIVYRLKPTPANSQPTNHVKKVPARYIKEYGQSPMAAMQFALDCFSINAIAYLAVHDLSGELVIITS